MKLLVMFAATALSASLVLPTVSQAESRPIAQQFAAAASSAQQAVRSA